ncbi:MAG: shikimate dehydrogenase [Gemmatimonadetes bacterium]|nr:shikimate dehydrogenase [Gemmatimonadota bacterium]
MIAREAPAGLVILGHPVAQSRSPVFQGAALQAAHLSQTYERVDVPPGTLDSALARCAAERLGGNVTMPYKEDVAARAAHLSDAARRSGAVNTFWHDRGQLVGHNTDVDGARASIEALASAAGHDGAVVFGAGGAASAVLLALDALGVRDVHLVARTPARAALLVARTGAAGVVHAADAPIVRDLTARASIVINATPVGFGDDHLPIAPEHLGPDTAAFDLVYRPGGTAWTRAVAASGRWAEDGLRMLVEQGAAAFRSWFAIEPDRAAMWAALDATPPPIRRAAARGTPHTG